MLGDAVMPFSLTLTLIAACGVLFICILLALHKDYHSGVAGTFGLGLLAISAFARIMAVITHEGPVVVSNLAMFFWVGTALFLGQLAVNFLYRSAKRDTTWYTDATSPKKRPENDRKAA